MSELGWLKDAIDKIEQKVDKLDDKLVDQNATLVKQSVVLEEHVRRTDIAEENIRIIKEEIKPLQKHVNNVSFVFKALGFISILIGSIYEIFSLLKFF